MFVEHISLWDIVFIPFLKLQVHISICLFRARYGAVDSGAAAARGCPASDAVSLWAALPHRGAPLPGAVAGGTAVVSFIAPLAAQICVRNKGCLIS